MATPESKVKKKIKDILDGVGPTLYYHMPVQNGMGAPSLDFIGCYLGNYFAVEAKEPGKDLTPRQGVTRDQIEAAGGMVMKVDGPEGYAALSKWIKEISLRESWSTD